MRVALTGGGTGGHIYPGIAIDAALRTDCAARGEEYESIFYGTQRGLESSIVEQAGIPLRFVPSRPLTRKLSFELVRTLGANASGVATAWRELSRFKPDVVIASGGYVCFPVVAAAYIARSGKRKVSIALLEENALPGLTNRLLTPFVNDIWGAFWTRPEAFGPRFLATGIPVRTSIRDAGPRAPARERLGIDPRATVILVMGGSQGARSINSATSKMVTGKQLPPDWWILQLTGRGEYEAVLQDQRDRPGTNRITVLPYLDDPAPAYAAADIAVSRAGGSTLAELAAVGRPAILIPYPHASDDHQNANARVFEEHGAARVIQDATLDADVLHRTLTETLVPAELAVMTKAAASLAPTDAAQIIVRRVNALRGGERTGDAETASP